MAPAEAAVPPAAVGAAVAAAVVAGGGGGWLRGGPSCLGRETRSFPRFTLRGRPRAVHVQRYKRPRTSLTVSVAFLRGLTKGLRRPPIEKVLGRFPRFAIRNWVRPGRAVRPTLHARSVIVTAMRAGFAVPAASATPGLATTQSATAAMTVGEIRSISPPLIGTVRPIWRGDSPIQGDAGHVLGADQ